MISSPEDQSVSLSPLGRNSSSEFQVSSSILVEQNSSQHVINPVKKVFLSKPEKRVSLGDVLRTNLAKNSSSEEFLTGPPVGGRLNQLNCGSRSSSADLSTSLSSEANRAFSIPNAYSRCFAFKNGDLEYTPNATQNLTQTSQTSQISQISQISQTSQTSCTASEPFLDTTAAITAQMETVFYSVDLNEGRTALLALREASKNLPDTRRFMVRYGLIPVLSSLLAGSEDSLTVEASIFTIFNLVLDKEGKRAAMAEDSGLLEAVLALARRERSFTEAAFEAAVGVLCSLTALRENRETLRLSRVVGLLAQELEKGSVRTKKDAAIGLCNFALDRAENKVELVHCGVVRVAVDLLDSGTVECTIEGELMALIANLVKVEEGCIALEAVGGVAVLVGIAEVGETRAKVCAVSALLSMAESSLGKSVIEELWREGGIPGLTALSKSGSAKGREKARRLLELMRSSIALRTK